MTGKIAIQGELGSYSHEACRNARPGLEVLPCRTFEDAIKAVRNGTAQQAMLPVENSTYGRVADIHRLLPHSGLHIVDEAFVRVHINLLAVPGATLDDIQQAHSHLVLLPQCGEFLRKHGIEGKVSPDNARAAREVSEQTDKGVAALASELAAGSAPTTPAPPARLPNAATSSTLPWPVNWPARSMAWMSWPAISKTTAITPPAL